MKKALSRGVCGVFFLTIFSAGFTNLADGPSGLAVDSSGNTYVVGAVPGQVENQLDFATVKYDSSGKLVWQNKYNSQKGYGEPYIAVDSSGNSYVVGPVKGSNPKDENDTDFATYKYDSAGNQSWVTRYQGPKKGSDWPTGIAVDNSGYIYVTGDTLVKENQKKMTYQYDYVTIKYDSSKGKRKLMKRYSGKSKSTQKSNRPNGIAVDSSGNVYVTGDSQAYVPKGTEGSGYDFATLKYNTKGKQIWVRLYNGSPQGIPSYNFPLAVVSDNTGNAYVVGSYMPEGGSGTIQQLIKYQYSSNKKQDGAQAWVQTYNLGSGSPKGVAVDSSGNVYTTGQISDTAGTDFLTVKYDSAGQQTWVRRYNGPSSSNPSGVAVDNAGNSYVAGTSNNQFIIVKYDSNGNNLVLFGEGSDPIGGSPKKIAVDSSSNVYVTGTPSSSGNYFTTVKYDSAGKQAWVSYYSGQ